MDMSHNHYVSWGQRRLRFMDGDVWESFIEVTGIHMIRNDSYHNFCASVMLYIVPIFCWYWYGKHFCLGVDVSVMILLSSSA